MKNQTYGRPIIGRTTISFTDCIERANLTIAQRNYGAILRNFIYEEAVLALAEYLEEHGSIHKGRFRLEVVEKPSRRDEAEKEAVAIETVLRQADRMEGGAA